MNNFIFIAWSLFATKFERENKERKKTNKKSHNVHKCTVQTVTLIGPIRTKTIRL